MPRQFIPFDDSYRVSAPVRVSRGVRSADLLCMSGQMDLDARGIPRNRGDLMAQTERSMSLLYDVLSHAGAERGDLLHLHVFYLAASVSDERAYRNEVEDLLPAELRPVLILTPLDSFPTEGAEVEIDGIAVIGASDNLSIASVDGRVAAARCGELVFAQAAAPIDPAGDVDIAGGVEQAMATIRSALETFDLSLADLDKLTAYATGDGATLQELTTMVGRAFDAPGPAFTPVHLPTVTGGAGVLLEAIAATTREGRQVVAREGAAFADAIRCGRLGFIGAQCATEGEGEGDIAAQTHATMRAVGDALSRIGADFRHMSKVNAYFGGKFDESQWHVNVGIRSSYYVEPGPASTGIEVASLHRSGASIAVDCLAVIDD